MISTILGKQNLTKKSNLVNINVLNNDMHIISCSGFFAYKYRCESNLHVKRNGAVKGP